MKGILIALLSLLPFVIQAQELKVTKITMLDADKTAVESPRYDLNNELCAVVKVKVESMDDLSFTGNIVGQATHNQDTYMLYLATGTRRLRIMHQNYLPLVVEFAEFGISIEGGRCYEISIASNAPKQQGQYGAGAQYLVFKSSSPLSEVVVNGEQWTISEGKAKKMVPLGKYEYQAKSGDLQARGTVEVTSTATSKIVNVKFSN